MSEDHTEFAAPDEREQPRRALPSWRYRLERPGGPNRGLSWRWSVGSPGSGRTSMPGRNGIGRSWRKSAGGRSSGRGRTRCGWWHRAERSALAAAHSAEAKERWQAEEAAAAPGLSSVLCLPLGGRRRVGSFPRGAAGSLTSRRPSPGR